MCHALIYPLSYALFFTSCVTLCSLDFVMLFLFACITLFSVDYVTFNCVNCDSLWFVCMQKCFYCRSTTSGKNNGACAQCCAGKCAVSFHVTCLVLAGFALEPSDWPQPTETYCERHQRTRFKVSSFCYTCNKQFSTEKGCEIDIERALFVFFFICKDIRIHFETSRCFPEDFKMDPAENVRRLLSDNLLGF